MAGDAGTKQDKPRDEEGQGPAPKQAQEAAEAKAQTLSEETKGSTPSEDPGRAGGAGLAEAEKKAKPRRKPAAKKAEGTAAAETKVDKEGAEAALAEGATEAPAAPVEPAAKDKPKPRRRRASAQEEPAPEAKPARRGRRDPTGLVTVRAHAKYVRTSARKARLVADHVRGKDVAEARAILAFSPRSVAEDWRKLLNSAVANAEHNHDLVGDDLRVLNATADEGPTLKRFRPRAMGRATPIRKRTSHLSITLTPKEN
jgi:ribosomal protein L22